MHVCLLSTCTLCLGRLTSPAVINFVSHSEAPSQGVRDISAPVVSPNDIIVMWMPPELQNWNGILTNYTVGRFGGGGGRDNMWA